MEFPRKGAEAEVKKISFKNKLVISKKRIVKKYRNKKLDLKIRKKRTRSEAKILSKCYSIIKVPKIFQVKEDETEIIMEFINSPRLKDTLESNISNCILVGKEIKKIHSEGIIHGDLTTSNILDTDNGPCFIDFGLGFFSSKLEDRATDLIVFKKTFNATHSSIKQYWGKVIEGYSPSKEMIERMEKIEKRARYH